MQFLHVTHARVCVHLRKDLYPAGAQPSISINTSISSQERDGEHETLCGCRVTDYKLGSTPLVDMSVEQLPACDIRRMESSSGYLFVSCAYPEINLQQLSLSQDCLFSVHVVTCITLSWEWRGGIQSGLEGPVLIIVVSFHMT